ncbi:hypothetical protein [Brevundimonas halotolerans]|uniref:Uncharacterized protein n=1 Tax=Brevundimonas halotolerans TaxID=69670 RepID=A0A7W9E773_9CAUL|nr:hypothetical protein [Brevundimonas halotolerans]MBB5659380.1 hypothetical protein [Brevundimonas halotolerans]
MILLTLFAGILAAFPGQPDDMGVCDVTELAQVRVEPLRLDGRRFCGEVEVRQLNDLLILMPPGTDLLTSENETIVLPHEWPERVPLHEGLYRIEGYIKVDPDCFDESKEQCVPIDRPVFFDVDLAEPRIR